MEGQEESELEIMSTVAKDCSLAGLLFRFTRYSRYCAAIHCCRCQLMPVQVVKVKGRRTNSFTFQLTERSMCGRYLYMGICDYSLESKNFLVVGCI